MLHFTAISEFLPISESDITYNDSIYMTNCRKKLIHRLFFSKNHHIIGIFDYICIINTFPGQYRPLKSPDGRNYP